MNGIAPGHSQVYMALIHGAGLGSWVWENLIPYLNYPAIALDFPGRGAEPSDLKHLGFEDYAQSVADVVASLETDNVVLVGHSIGGAVAMRVTNMVPEKISSVVLVGGTVPKSGRSNLSVSPFIENAMLRVIFFFSPTVKPPENLIKQLCAGLDGATADMVLSKYNRESARLFTDPVQWNPLPDSIPVYYVKDTYLDQDIQNQIVRRVKAEKVFKLGHGHLPMLETPEELGGIINLVAGGALAGAGV
ncbi:MAG: alpha/beta hydrolase [Nitrospinae bacterium]|nr:alpha/beta hydrolase [Nitrospinota bacterium]